MCSSDLANYVAAGVVLPTLEGVTEANVIDGLNRVVNQKTYYIIQQYAALRELFGQLLKEIQRIKSQGDYKAAQVLVETYGVKLNPNLHREVLRRYETLKIAPYAGFIQPQLIPVYKGNQIIDVKIEYPEQFKSQMMYYGSHYSFLPAYND